MIYTIISILVFFWLVGLLAHVGGAFIHGLLVLALCVYIYKFIASRGAGA